MKSDNEYREILLDPVRTCLSYTPKMGQRDHVDLNTFIRLYQEDPLYHWLGFDNPTLYTIHKAAGGMTSLYRQVGIGVERLTRTVISDAYHLTEDQSKWSYNHVTDDGKVKKRTLDSRVDLSHLGNRKARTVFSAWLEQAKSDLGISVHLNGSVFEVREGYKSADSKRQNADLENSANALGSGYLMVMMVMSDQINSTVCARYQNANMLVLRGSLIDNPFVSTYAFFKDVVGYDLASFFERNSPAIKNEIEQVLDYIVEVPN